MRVSGSAIVGVTAVLALAGVGWWHFRSSDAITPQRLAEYEPNAGVTVQKKTGPSTNRLASKDPEIAILAQLESTDPAVRQQGIDRLRQICRLSPQTVSNDLSKWIKPLMLAGLSEQILTVTDKSIATKAADSSAISDIQFARASALLALKRYPEARQAFRTAFNVATQATTNRVISSVLTLSADEGITQKLAVDLKDDLLGDGSGGALSTLTAPVLASHDYDQAISVVSSQDTIKGKVALGNLLLLSNRPHDAAAEFEKLVASPSTKGKDLANALEGIARARRARTGSLTEGNRVIKLLRMGVKDAEPVQFAKTLDQNRIRQLQDAAQRIPYATLARAPSDNIDYAALASKDVPSPAIALANLLRQTAPSETAVINWFEKYRGVDETSEADRARLKGAVAASGLKATTLIELASAAYQDQSDRSTANAIMAAAVPRIEAAMSPQAAKQESLELAQAIMQHREQYKNALQSEFSGKNQTEAIDTLARVYRAFLSRASELGVNRLDINAVTIAYAECVFCKGQWEESISLVAPLKDVKLTKGEDRAVTWLTANALISLNRPGEAIAGLLSLAKDDGFMAREGAIQLGFRTSIEAGEYQAAGEFLKVYRPMLPITDSGFAEMNSHLETLKSRRSKRGS